MINKQLNRSYLGTVQIEHTDLTSVYALVRIVPKGTIENSMTLKDRGNVVMNDSTIRLRLAKIFVKDGKLNFKLMYDGTTLYYCAKGQSGV